MPAFYTKEDGAALSVTINKYVYVIVHEHGEMIHRFGLGEAESVSNVNDMQHVITRETLKYFGLSRGITTASVSDVMVRGSGLGSSSAFTVGLINAISRSERDELGMEYLASMACDIEMNNCGYPVGKQDQYAAAYGGINLFSFKYDGTVGRQSINIQKKQLDALEDNLLLIYSGQERHSSTILQEQQHGMVDPSKFNAVAESRDTAYQAVRWLARGDIDYIGQAFNDSWHNKKTLASTISNEYIDSVYNHAMRSGAVGGKLLGAGGGGFFIFYTPDKEKVSREITSKFPDCKPYDFRFTNKGSEILLIDSEC